MKELSIEEKAKAYDELFAKAKTMTVENTNEVDGAKILTKLFPQLAESEDERIRKELIDYFKENNAALAFKGISNECVIAWLEEQGQHKKFRDSIQIGDKVTRNEDGVLVNLSQLKRVAKKDEKQGEQKPWSEEDEKERKRVVGLLEGWLSTFKETCYAEDCKCGIDWLKSLRPQSQWKPSDEQVDNK